MKGMLKLPKPLTHMVVGLGRWNFIDFSGLLVSQAMVLRLDLCPGRAAPPTALDPLLPRLTGPHVGGACG